ncbi:MAG: Tfp pilus assembly protein ATPase PilM [Armatimonadetes bacterium]|jgi:Tfp pilus assembly protein PilN|nr:Tfp pilus assembly protein ATPase PilM [Armatimonadota bacterium]
MRNHSVIGKATARRGDHARSEIVVASISGSEARVVEASRRGSEVIVHRWGTAEAAAGDEGRAKAIVQALEKAGIRERRIVLCLSARAVVIRRVELPPAAPDQLEQLVAYEAQRHLPLPVDQLATGYHVLETPGAASGKPGGAPGIDVLLAVTRKAELARLERALIAAGLRVEGYAVAPLAVTDAWLPEVEPAMNGTPWLLVAPDENGMVAQAIHRGSPIFTRFLPGNDGGWRADLRRTLAAHAVQYPDSAIRQVALAGGEDADLLAQATGLPARSYGSAGSAPGCSELPPDWGALAGAVRQWLGAGRYPLRIDAQGRTEAAQTQSRSRALLGAAAALALAVVLGTWQFDRMRAGSAGIEEASRLNQQAADDRKLLTALVKQREKLRNQWEAIGGAQAASADEPLELLRKAAAIAPPGVWLTEMSFERGQPLRLQGTARDAAQVNKWLRSLERVGEFRAVELGFLRSANVADTPVTQFRIDCTVSNPAAAGGGTGRAGQEVSR